jgi:protein O-mannosyl-transferase
MSGLTQEAPEKVISAAEQETGMSRCRRRRALIWCLIAALIATTVTAYWSCLGHPFVHFDDPDYVTQNPHVQAGLTADSIRWAFTTFDCGNWHPLTWLSLELDSTLYGSQALGFLPTRLLRETAGGFHLTNLLLHTASTLLLFLALVRMTGLVWRSGVVAALFALHPLSVESVAWVAERKGVLSTFFWMLTLAAYVYYVERPGIRRYLLVLLALVAGLMAKPMLVTLPCVLLLLDYWPLRRVGQDADPFGQRSLRSAGFADGIAEKGSESYPTKRSFQSAIFEKLPLVAVVFGWSVLAYLAQNRVGALPSFERYPPEVRVWNALLAYVAYLGKVILPLDLAAYYPHPGASVSVVWAVMAALFLGLVTALVLGLGRRWPYLAVGWLWYLVALVPVIGLVQIGDHGMADRYVYVPMIGLFLASTWGLAGLAATWHVPRVCLAVLAAGALAACFFLTRAQAQSWKSDKDLWEDALAANQNNAMAHNNLGAYFKREGQNVRAEREFAQAVKIQPGSALFHHNLATVLADRGRLAEATAECDRALALDAGPAIYHYTLGNLLRDQGQEQESLAEFREAARLEPENPLTHGNLANALLDCDFRDQAVAEYRKAIELDPQYDSPHLGLGKLLAEEERFEEAAAEFRQAIDLAPKNALAHLNLAMALQAGGRLEDALQEYGQAEKRGLPTAGPAWRACQRLHKFQTRLPGLLTGRDHATTNADRLGFAHLCGQPFEARYALAARLFNEAFRADPAWVDDLHAVDRVDAAVAGARAGCGQGRDAGMLDERQKAEMRQQARQWLESELAMWTERARMPGAAPMVRKTLRNWQRSPGFAGVREPAALAKLPPPERRAWQILWQAIEARRAEIKRQRQITDFRAAR